MALLWSPTVIPYKSEGGRERRGKTGGTVERLVCIETGEMDHENSVGPWPPFPRIKREIGRGKKLVSCHERRV